MSANNENNLALGLKLAALGFAVFGIFLYLFFLLGVSLDSRGWVIRAGHISFAISMSLTLGGLILCWRKIRLAGVLLIFSFVSLLVFLFYSGIDNRFDFDSLLFGFPSLVAGLLLLFSWKLSKKARSSA